MLKKSLLLLIALAIVPALAAETDVWIESRGIQVPATLVMPDVVPGVASPLVVLVHGHGGTRQENGAFTELASLLAAVGIASIRMDLPGCGDSTEPFSQIYMTIMLQDIVATFDFAVALPGVDTGRLGILGYSLGVRLAMLTIADEPA